MSMEQLLIQLGINISSSVIYDVVKNYLLNHADENATVDGLQTDLASYLRIENANIKAEGIIKFLAQNGDIIISGTHINASKSITLASTTGTQFKFGDNSSSKTDKTFIEAGNGAQIIGQGGARIEQDEDGNIKFFT